ncbi:MAG: 3-isopropylmalate dehydratase small subunit [Proteobacteria bacterium]|nr:3-isopropylmalate dehydratase small subunit [Pseudomonadota bacterium]
MQKFTTLTVSADKTAFMPIANIDTDMIIPKQYLKTIKRSGLGRWLFAEMRYEADGKSRADFILNQKPEAQILLAGENFGCGSSREHAPWSLMDFGIRAVIAPGFADIFYNNSYKNGLLLIKLPKESVEALASSSGEITIDLATQSVTGAGQSYRFEIEPNIKEILLGGLDAIESILLHKDKIKTYEAEHFTRQPWLKAR